MIQTNPCAFSRSALSTIVAHDATQAWAINEPAINLFVWRRTVPGGLSQFVDAAVAWRDIKRVISCPAAAPDIDGLLADVPPECGFELLRADMLELAQLFAHLTGAEHLTLKLESFGSNLCERFHVDCVPLRLICSYAGPGTEWLDNAEVDRAYLEPGAGGWPDEQSGLLRPGATIGRLERFAMALMKGERWPGNAGNGLVHRSPRIANSGIRRVLFKIDPGSRKDQAPRRR
jgi:hypothetical protein